MTTAPRQFVHDLPTDKLHITTGGKADWLTIPEADQRSIKSACLWSKSRNCWVSRSKANRAKWQLVAMLTRLGFVDMGEQGERLTFAEQIEAKQERAEERADRAEDRATTADKEAHARFNSHNIETLRGMAGEPIKIGHHSEKRHRRLIEKADNDMRKGCEAMDRSKHYERRAEAARATAEGAEYSDPAFLGRRIKEQEAVERLILRWLNKGDFSKEYRNQRLAEVHDKLGFYRHCLETCGRMVWTKETLADKTEVKIRGDWYKIRRLNKTTVSVPDPHLEKYTWKKAYCEVQDAR